MQLTGVGASEGPTSLAPIDLGLLREFVPSRVVSMVKFVPELHRVTLPLYTNVERPWLSRWGPRLTYENLV
jgi:hypothetical protein